MIKTPISFDVGDEGRWVVVGANGYHLPIAFAPEVCRRVNAHTDLVEALEWWEKHAEEDAEQGEPWLGRK